MVTIHKQMTKKGIVDQLVEALQEENFTVVTIENPEYLFQQIEFFKPHLVVLDYKLSSEDCVKICQQIKGKYPALPVIALSCNMNIHITDLTRFHLENTHGQLIDADHLYSVIRRYIPALRRRRSA